MVTRSKVSGDGGEEAESAGEIVGQEESTGGDWWSRQCPWGCWWILGGFGRIVGLMGLRRMGGSLPHLPG